MDCYFYFAIMKPHRQEQKKRSICFVREETYWLAINYSMLCCKVAVMQLTLAFRFAKSVAFKENNCNFRKDEALILIVKWILLMCL